MSFLKNLSNNHMNIQQLCYEIACVAWSKKICSNCKKVMCSVHMFYSYFIMFWYIYLYFIAIFDTFFLQIIV